MTDILSALFLALALGSGLYALYTAIRLKKNGVLFENKFLYPSNCPPAVCTDEVGFIQCIFPCILTIGVVDTLVGIAFGLAVFLKVLALPDWATDFVLPGLAIAPFVWVVIVQSKAAKLYW